MDTLHEVSSVAQFGVFCLDRNSGELRKAGRKIKIRGQPLQVLVVLVERHGEIVPRSELHHRLWPENSLVDFEHGLNKAISKIRGALNDSADHPKFVETLPGQGYRFIAPAQWIRPEAEKGKQTERFVASRHMRRWVGGVVASILVLTGSAWLYRYERHSKGDTLVLADFSNSTGDAVFDDTLKTALSVSLNQSPFLNVLPENKVAATLELMARPKNTVLTPEVARELCQRVGSKAYVAGSISALGSQYVLGLKAVSCHSGDLLGQEQVTAAQKEKVLDALGSATAKLRGALGESLAMVQKYDVPLAEATTSSLEALKAFSLGLKAAREKGAAAALPYDQRAIQIDPRFALGYKSVGDDYWSMSEVGRASEYYAKAFQLREHASEREKLNITADYYSSATGELDKAAQTLQELITSYPRDSGEYSSLGTVLTPQGQYEKAADAYRHCIQLDPDYVFAYENLGNADLALQRFEDARLTIREAQTRKLDDFILHLQLYAIAFLGTDPARMEEQKKWFTGRPEENIVLSLASDTEAYSGHLRRARDLTQRSVDSAARADSKETGAIWYENAALREAAFYNLVEAKRTIAQGLRLYHTSQAVQVEAALAYAMAGDTAKAESLALELNARFPMDTQVQALWLPSVRAQVALDRKNPVEAVHDLETVSGPIELAQFNFLVNLSCLYPTYIRGQAYLADGQGGEAAAEFQKILDHSGIVWNCWTGALSHLGVARANAMQARASHGSDADAARARALAAYKDFLALWEDADPDILVLKQAKAEYVKLH